MKTTQLSGAFVALICTLLMTACGSKDPNASKPTDGSSAGQSPSSAEIASRSQQEEITPGGIAVVVLDHLGRDTVRQVLTFTGEGEDGSVGVMVRLRDRTPHNFSVSVYPPEAAEDYGQVGKCAPMRQRVAESSRCRTLDDGRTVMTTEISQGFSDDNRNGSLLMGSVVTPEQGAVMAMYESYDESPAISVTQLEELLSDSRLTWLTPLEVNEAGKGVNLKEVAG